MKKITILGSTGSIGRSTLDILSHHQDHFRVIALSAKSQLEVLASQCEQFRPSYAVVDSPQAAKQLEEKLANAKVPTTVLYGQESLQDVASLDEVDYVMAAIVGAAGLLPTLAAAKAGKRILLANKEALVMSGELFMSTLDEFKATLLPVDSEHNAIFQCMPFNYRAGQKPLGVEKIILTASGGPFRTLALDAFADITPEQAILHPNWSMGAKISVDSASMMNKVLEVIEAYWLFNQSFENIEVIVHPQSIIHSLVSYQDGSFLAQLGQPDMRIPIAHALSWPQRMNVEVKRLNLIEISQLTFEPIDLKRFPSLQLAYAVLKAGGTAPAILNAANEVAVSSFLKKEIRFDQIVSTISEVLEKSEIRRATAYDVILEADRHAREDALNIVHSLKVSIS